MWTWKLYRRGERWFIEQLEPTTRHAGTIVRGIAAAFGLVTVLTLVAVIPGVLPWDPRTDYFAALFMALGVFFLPTVAKGAWRARKTRTAQSIAEPPEPRPRRIRNLLRSKDYETVIEEKLHDKILYEERPHFLFLFAATRWVPIALAVAAGLSWIGESQDLWYLHLAWVPVAWYSWRCWCRWAYVDRRMTYRETTISFQPPVLTFMGSESPAFPSDALRKCKIFKPWWLRLLFFFDCAHISFDTIIEDDVELHDLRFMKHPKRVKQAYDVLREHYHPSHVDSELQNPQQAKNTP